MSTTPTAPQDTATAGVAGAFSSTAPAGLTPAQQAAYAGVQKAFSTTPTTNKAPILATSSSSTAIDTTQQTYLAFGSLAIGASGQTCTVNGLTVEVMK